VNYAQGFLFSEAVASGSAHFFFNGFGEILRPKPTVKTAEVTGQRDDVSSKTAL
jgi:hypothetical protein